jgi:hypothetical protein
VSAGDELDATLRRIERATALTRALPEPPRSEDAHVLRSLLTDYANAVRTIRARAAALRDRIGRSAIDVRQIGRRVDRLERRGGAGR